MRDMGWFGGEPPRRLLAIGAHSDDLEIGCGGSILALTRASPQLEVRWVVLAANGDRAEEARRSAESFLAGVSNPAIEIHSFRDGYLPYDGGAVKDEFESLKSFDPELVLTHTRDDFHQDHRLACELTWNTFRDHLVLEYEIPKCDGDIGRPNAYMPLAEARSSSEKLALLTRTSGVSGTSTGSMSSVFRGLMRLRGMECRSASGFAEAFVARKVTLAYHNAMAAS